MNLTVIQKKLLKGQFKSMCGLGFFCQSLRAYLAMYVTTTIIMIKLDSLRVYKDEKSTLRQLMINIQSARKKKQKNISN